MTYTITIDQPIKLEKTHFFDDTELMYYIAKSRLKSWDVSITSKSKSHKTQYQKAMEDFKKWKNIISMSDNIQTEDQFIQFIKQST